MFVDQAFVENRELSALVRALRHRLQWRHEIPVAVVLSEITKALIGIEEEIFFPLEGFAVLDDSASLEADRFPGGSAESPARAERDYRRAAALLGLDLLQNLEQRRGCVEDREALRTDHGHCVAEASPLDRPAAIGAGERVRFGDRGLLGLRIHDHPSNWRRFLSCNSSNSTHSPKNSSGAASL